MYVQLNAWLGFLELLALHIYLTNTPSLFETRWVTDKDVDEVVTVLLPSYKLVYLLFQ